MDRHRDRFAANQRIGMIYRNWDKKSDQDKARIIARAEWCLANVDEL